MALKDIISCPRRHQKANSVDTKTVSWELLNCVPGTVALLCMGEDLRVVKATKQASRIWGSFALDDCPFLTLMKSPQRGETLKSMTQRMVCGSSGFAAKEFGCAEMTAKSGRVWDSFIKIAHISDD